MKKISILIISLVLLLTACSKKQEEMVEPVIEEPIVEVNSASLIMGGDALTHESVYLDNKIGDNYDFTYPFSQIKKIVLGYDIAYYNQETVLGGKEYGVSGYPTFNTPQEVGDALLDCGFNVISLATNHVMDNYGNVENTLINSQLDYFKDKNVLTAGSYLSNEDKQQLKIKEVNGITYTLLSYTYGSNYGVPNNEYELNFIDEDKIKEDVAKYRDKVDLLMVAMHWGEEGSSEINDYQNYYANLLADLDVDIVIGTHPHVLQPIEWIDDTLVIYSLGNLYSNQYFNIDNLSSALISLNVVKTTIDGVSSIELKDLKADLIFTVLSDRHAVHLYKDLSENELKDKDYYFNKYKDILTSKCSELVVE